MLISSSGNKPANLQGLWNGSWSCDYTQDENLQMNYWSALPGNMAELTNSYFDLVESELEDWRHNAIQLFGCRGVLASIKSTIHARLLHISRDWPWMCYTAAAGWLAQLFFDYWLYTGDKDFLAERTVPLLKEIVLFYEDFLVEDNSGKLVFTPSLSPENTRLSSDVKTTVNATMDISVAHEVLTNLITASKELGIDHHLIPKYERILNKLPEYKTNAVGCKNTTVINI